MTQKLMEVCKAFRINGIFLSYEEIKVGNVNHTYKVNFLHTDGNSKSYIVQSVNTFAFKKPIEVMENIDKVTEHIRAKKPGSVALHFHHTADRKTYFFDDSGFWRLMNDIPSTSYNACTDMDIVRNAGAAFGEFQMQLSDFDAAQLHETILGFHDTRKRYADMEAGIAADPCGRAQEVQEEIAWLLSVREDACTLTDMYREGKLPMRVTHNDAKINNVLFEPGGKRAIVVIDLDTVMPGLVGHDFGDAIRFAANVMPEDCRDPACACVNMDVFRAFAEGFLTQTAATLTQDEVDTLAISCFGLTCELATRFLNDYIQGDLYFKIEYPEHNLVRACCQIDLAKDMLTHMDEMKKVVNECVTRCRTFK